MKIKRRRPRRQLRVAIYPTRKGWNADVESRANYLYDWDHLILRPGLDPELHLAVQRVENAMIYLEGLLPR